jgi:hypothetical protein
MALKVITPSANTGFDPVGADDYRSGMIAARDADGNVIVCGSALDSTDKGSKPIGILGEDRLTSTLQATTQVEEEVTVAIGVGIALAHDDLVTGSWRLFRTTDGPTDPLKEGASDDFEINKTTGVVTFHTNTNPGDHNLQAGDVVKVAYTFNLNDDFEKNFRGVNFKGATDDTEGSKKATVWKGHGEFETDQFVTSQAYLVGDLLQVTTSGHAMGAGLLTNEAGDAGATVGVTSTARVEKVPTASDPFLGFEWVPVLA